VIEAPMVVAVAWKRCAQVRYVMFWCGGRGATLEAVLLSHAAAFQVAGCHKSAYGLRSTPFINMCQYIWKVKEYQ
jgi:hypothetical protein